MKTHRENYARLSRSRTARRSNAGHTSLCRGAGARASPPPQVPPGPVAPAPEVTFKVEVNYVEEDVRVVDRDGNFVRGLKQEDFQVLEDGKPQKVQTFGMVDIPNTRPRKPLYLGPDALPIEPDVAVNKQVLDGRLYLIVLDDYHVAPLRSQNVRNLARRFVLEKLGPDDQAAVVVTSGLTASVAGLHAESPAARGSDRELRRPEAALVGASTRNERMSRQMDAQGRPTDDAGDPITIDPSNRFVADDMATERMFQTRQALNSLRSIAEWMSAIQGRRKAIVFISEGVDYNLFDIFTGGDPANFNFENFNMVQTGDVGHRLGRIAQQRADLCGRSAWLDDDGAGGHRDRRPGARRLRPRAEAALAGAADLAGQPARSLPKRPAASHSSGATTSMQAFDRIVQENSSYYVLGYYSTNERRDGRLRNITVRVAGYPDAQVTYRKRYAAPRGRAPRNTAAGKPLDPSKSLTAELVSTMASPLPKTGIQLRLTAIAKKGAGKNSDVEVLIDTLGRDLTFTREERHVQQPLVALARRVQQAREVGVRRAARRRSESAPRIPCARHGEWRAHCCGTCRCLRDDISFAWPRRTAAR